MNSGKYPILAREGWMHVALAVGAAAITHYYLGWLWASPLWVVSLFVLQFLLLFFKGSFQVSNVSNSNL